MKSVIDKRPSDSEYTALRPFGPTIIKMRIPDNVQEILWAAFDKSDTAYDYNQHLAGNIKREFELTQETLGTQGSAMFVDMLGDGGSRLYKESIAQTWINLKDTLTTEHIQMIEPQLEQMYLTVAIQSAWGNISVAGDFNPAHSHSEKISGVGYLKLPDNIEQEWQQEDHEPSVGMLSFIDGRQQAMVSANIRIKPQVGDIYFFPAWLLHSVAPFRSTGERWSFSFNISVENMNSDIILTDDQKFELQEIQNAKD